MDPTHTAKWALAKRPTCELCDTHGPDFPRPFGEAWLDFHRAQHNLAWLLILGPMDLLLRRMLIVPLDALLGKVNRGPR